MSVAMFKAAALLGASGIAFGAFGAHGLAQLPNISERHLSSWATAVKYQELSAVALLALHALPATLPVPKYLTFSKRLIFSGALLFSGSIYGLVLSAASTSGSNMKWLGPVTPLGGLLMITGWACLIF